MVWVYGLVIVISYLLGSFNSSIIVSHFYAKDDVRNHGSGNAGMTNTLRTYGIKPAIYTIIGDFSKGILAVIIARYVIFRGIFGIPFVTASLGLDVGYVAGFFVLIGHVYPLYFKFRGGKGAMTALGVLCIIDPIVFIAILAVALPIVFKSRYVSLGSIVGAILFPVFTMVMRMITGRPIWMDTICALIIGLLILVLHRSNIKRLLSGTENHFTPPSK